MADAVRAVFAGTFDPPHRGHLDLIERGSRFVDELIVAVAINRDKQCALTAEERLALLKICTATLPKVRVVSFEGLVVDLAAQEDARFLLRGARSSRDYEAEAQMADTNRQLLRDGPTAPPREIETLLLCTRPELAHITSSRIREVAGFGGEVRPFLPEVVADRIAKSLPAATS
ncbi:MAG: pantetheine-phosphate adenylyltransferase [Planctomycetota bacterium]